MGRSSSSSQGRRPGRSRPRGPRSVGSIVREKLALGRESSGGENRKGLRGITGGTEGGKVAECKECLDVVYLD